MSGFSNTQTQQDILQNSNTAVRGSLQPDPVGIDGEQQDTKANAVSGGKQELAGGAQAATGTQMAEELDGLNKYLAGVRVPGAIKAQPSYTLQNMRQDE